MQGCANRLRKFVWSKVGVEAGQSLTDIIARKESERLQNDGFFLWGIGNNVGLPIDALARSQHPEVFFSLIVSQPRACDEAPEEVFAWTEAETIGGLPYSIPRGSVVTSRAGANKRFHYALVCQSETPICLSASADEVYSGSLRNLLSGRPVGSSQVTSVVESDDSVILGRPYQVAMKFKLAPPYFVRLLNPIVVPHRVRVGLGSAVKRDMALSDLRGLMSASRNVRHPSRELCAA